MKRLVGCLVLGLSGCVAQVGDVEAVDEDLVIAEIDVCVGQRIRFDGACRGVTYFERFVSDDAELVSVAGSRGGELGAAVTERATSGMLRVLSVEPERTTTARRRDRVYRADHAITDVHEYWAVIGEHPHRAGEPWPWLVERVLGRTRDRLGFATWGVADWTMRTDNPNTPAPCELHMDGTYDCVQALGSGVFDYHFGGDPLTCAEVARDAASILYDECTDTLLDVVGAGGPLGFGARLFIMYTPNFSYHAPSLAALSGLAADAQLLVENICQPVRSEAEERFKSTCILDWIAPPQVSAPTMGCADGGSGCVCPDGQELVQGNAFYVCSSGSWVLTELGTTTDPISGDVIESVTVTTTDGHYCAEMPLPPGGICAEVG